MSCVCSLCSHPWRQVGDRRVKDGAPIGIDADCNYFLGEFEAGGAASFAVRAGRKAYVLQVEGRSRLSEQFELEEGDAATAQGPEELRFQVLDTSLLLVIEMQA